MGHTTGSHKTNVALPDHYRDLEKYRDENVRPIPAAAGDCIICKPPPAAGCLFPTALRR
jgi:hypothetical protein